MGPFQPRIFCNSVILWELRGIRAVLSSPCPIIEREDFCREPRRGPSEQVFFRLQWQQNSLEKSARISEKLGEFWALHQLGESCCKKGQGALGYLRGSTKPYCVPKSGRHNANPHLLHFRWNWNAFITPNAVFCPSFCPQGASFFDVLSGFNVYNTAWVIAQPACHFPPWKRTDAECQMLPRQPVAPFCVPAWVLPSSLTSASGRGVAAATSFPKTKIHPCCIPHARCLIAVQDWSTSTNLLDVLQENRVGDGKAEPTSPSRCLMWIW